MTHMNHHAKIVKRKNERGAALVVALVLLLAMTILGVSSMSTTGMEMRMAANDQFLENAFQLSETGLDTVLAALNSGDLPVPNAITPGGCDPEAAAVAVPSLGGAYTTEICWMGNAHDFTAPSGSSIGKVTTYHFQNNSRGTAEGSAFSLNHMGIKVLGPGVP